jgi:hypothetical protein
MHSSTVVMSLNTHRISFVSSRNEVALDHRGVSSLCADGELHFSAPNVRTMTGQQDLRDTRKYLLKEADLPVSRRAMRKINGALCRAASRRSAAGPNTNGRKFRLLRKP